MIVAGERLCNSNVSVPGQGSRAPVSTAVPGGEEGEKSVGIPSGPCLESFESRESSPSRGAEMGDRGWRLLVTMAMVVVG